MSFIASVSGDKCSEAPLKECDLPSAATSLSIASYSAQGTSRCGHRMSTDGVDLGTLERVGEELLACDGLFRLS